MALTNFWEALAVNNCDGCWISWNENDGNACAWGGVTCTYNFTAPALDLSSWRLTYVDSLGDLSNLDVRMLDMSSNYIFPQIPDEIGSLTQLAQLDLSGNLLYGLIPANSSACRSLRYLSLEQNELEGEIPDLNELGHLQFLLLAEYYLAGSFSKELAEISSLLSIDLPDSQLHGSIPSLVNLKLDNNLFVGFEEPLYLNAPNLQYWDVSANQQEGMVPLALTNLSSLSVLNMSCNRLSGQIPSGFSFPGYNEVVFSQNQVGGNDFSRPSLPPGPMSFGVWFSFSGYIEVDFFQNQVGGNDFSRPSLPPGPLSFGVQVDWATAPELIPLNSSPIFPSGGGGGICAGHVCPCSCLQTSVRSWTLFAILGGLVLIALGTCAVGAIAWKWRVYQKRHEQDADLIKTLQERDSATLMCLQDLKRATNNFSGSVRIGEGGFGAVYMGELNNGTKVAIKKSKREGSEEDKQQFLNEVRILSQVNHRHLVKLLGCCMENKVSLLVFEFVSNGTLQEHLQGKIGDVGLSWEQRLNIAVQTADALSYLHNGTNFSIYHRDVKSANILLNNHLSAKVADFGISKLAPMQATHISTSGMGTIGYVDPEYYTYRRLTDRSDVYSFGVVLLELISAKQAVFEMDGEPINLVMFATPLIESGDMQPLIDQILLETYNHTSGHDKESILNLGRLAMKCLAMPSKDRPSMTEVWKELQNLYLKLNGTSMNEDFGSLNEEAYIENPCCDHRVLLSQIFSDHSYSSDMQNDPRSLELSYTIQDLDQSS